MGSDNASDGDGWNSKILSSLKGAVAEGETTGKKALSVKRLRRIVLLSLQMDESDKKAKKKFKRSIQEMEAEGVVSLSAEGIVTLKKKQKSDKEKRKKKKRRKESDEQNNDEDESKEIAEGDDKEIQESTENNTKMVNSECEEGAPKQNSCKGNPQGVTRLFLGNLPFAVDETSLGAFLPGNATHIKWITDKETGKFYGSAFCEMDTAVHAAEAVAKAGSQLMGRPIKINFAPARPGDVWPPTKKVVSGGGQAGGTGVKAMSAKPENCVKLFIGNLSYDIDDDTITKFFANVDAEVKAVRWLHHKDTGDFKGCGFVEFWNTDACDKAATLNGKNLLGRPIRIDWTD